jgi:hypothetical protein
MINFLRKLFKQLICTIGVLKEKIIDTGKVIFWYLQIVLIIVV